jgi:hypothetical protein
MLALWLDTTHCLGASDSRWLSTEHAPALTHRVVSRSPIGDGAPMRLREGEGSPRGREKTHAQRVERFLQIGVSVLAIRSKSRSDSALAETTTPCVLQPGFAWWV